MRRTLTSLTIALVLVLAACGNDDTEAATNGAAGSDPMPEPVCLADEQEILDEYVGLTEDEAADLAADQALDIREVGRDGECHAITMDLRDDRVNVEYVGDVVVGAAIF